MKRFVLTVLLGVIFGAGVAHAADYKSALLLVRQSNYTAALSEFKVLAAEGHVASQYSIGLIYHLGRGVQADPETAYMWYKKAALVEYAPALNNLGMMYLNGEYVAANQEVAFKLFLKASVSHAQAKDNLAQCYELGWGVERNAVDAADMYQKSGDAGYAIGWLHLAQMYETGYDDLPKDMDKAVEWYIKAAERGVSAARIKLAELGRLPPELAQ